MSPFPAGSLCGKNYLTLMSVPVKNPPLTGDPQTNGVPQLKHQSEVSGSWISLDSYNSAAEDRSGYTSLSNQFILKISHSTDEKKIFLTPILVTTELSAADLDSDISSVDSDKCLLNISSRPLECRVGLSSLDVSKYFKVNFRQYEEWVGAF